MGEALKAHRQVVSEMAAKRLGRPLTTREASCLERVSSLMMLEVMESEMQSLSPQQIEHLLNAPDIPADALGCAQCGRILAQLDHSGDAFDPAPDVLAAGGAVAIPNFGWFCSQECGEEYERIRGTRFARDASGRIHYE
ncbi:hypothetical protein WME79_31230 [Sorangium sp. So ce726]|uniref:hypothetical protein n=1 Tax=Sorangium sp. So ce726 TaxID=3133319 RepID=UPI003F62FA2A